MTEAEFISIHFPNGSENIPGSLHLNVTQVPNSSQGLISSMIITTHAFSIDGQTTNTYIEGVLEQIETVSFVFAGETYELTVTSTAYYPASNPFFYYTVAPAYVSNYFDANVFVEGGVNTQVTFTPYLLDVEFGFSEFNPLISNASENRSSYRLMVSDRNNQTVLPSNIDALLNLTADKASVQDYLYDDSGWTNARYRGTETSAALSRAGIKPSLSGRSFVGEVFPSGSDTDYICKLDNRVNQELFHTSDTPLPRYEVEDDFVLLSSQILGGGTTPQTIINYTSIATARQPLSIGDVLIPNGALESMRVVGIDTENQKVTVERDIYRVMIFGSFPAYSAGTQFNRVLRFDIFRFQRTGTERVVLVNNSRVYVNGNNAIIDTDDFGNILSSSFCPRFNAEIDTD